MATVYPAAHNLCAAAYSEHTDEFEKLSVVAQNAHTKMNKPRESNGGPANGGPANGGPAKEAAPHGGPKLQRAGPAYGGLLMHGSPANGGPRLYYPIYPRGGAPHSCSVVARMLA